MTRLARLTRADGGPAPRAPRDIWSKKKAGVPSVARPAGSMQERV